MASTYPIEVVQAERWLQANKKLTGDQLEAAVAKQDWDDSIKSLAGDAERAGHDEFEARLDAKAR